jgi:ribose/xylose/arabinose/galactoside ABC-type transport system permease subunit
VTTWLFGRHGDAVTRYGVLLAVLAVVVVLGEAIAPATLAASNLATMTTFGVPLGLMAFGEALVILGGGGAIDLSIGGLYPLAPVVAALLMGHHVSEWLAVLAALGVGVAGGLVNGVIVVGFGIPAIIVTLGTLYGYSGLAEVIANGVNLTSFPTNYGDIGQGMVGGVPNQLLFIYLPIAVLLWYVAGRSVYAYRIRLAGTNPVAAYLSGVNVRSVRLKAYVISGLLAALAGVVESSLIMTASPTAGGVFTVFVVVTIVVLGGVDLFGGEGTVVGIVIATAVLMVLGYSFDLANANSILETGLTGVLLIVALLGRLGLARFRARLGVST